MPIPLTKYEMAEAIELVIMGEFDRLVEAKKYINKQKEKVRLAKVNDDFFNRYVC